MNDRHVGVCRRWSPRTGAGIVVSRGRQHVVMRDELLEVLNLRPGQRVEFSCDETPDGLRAVNVRPVEFR